ncbi:MAG: SDR family oxidoreductase [Bacteroidales bacterium]|nr:SDR family oxidoreductase [Bacteroidales bacterium]
MKNKILVTGATGTIGTFVCKQLKDRNAEFTALVRSREKAMSLADQGIEIAFGDLSDRESLQKAMTGIDKLFLLSTTSPLSPELQGNAVQTAQKAGIKHIVKIAARGSSPNADFNIGRWHGMIEDEIRKSGISYTFLQAHTFMQNLLFDAESIKKDNAIYNIQGDGKIPMIDARDIAEVAVIALTQGDHHFHKTYDLTGPEAISYKDIANELSHLLGREIRYINQTTDEGRKNMQSSGMPEWLIDDMIHLNKKYAFDEASEVSPDVENLLERKPHTIRTFLKDYKMHFE